MSLKNPVTPPGIDPGTVRLVAQRLNHYATRGPFVRKSLFKSANRIYFVRKFKYFFTAVTNFLTKVCGPDTRFYLTEPKVSFATQSDSNGRTSMAVATHRTARTFCKARHDM